MENVLIGLAVFLVILLICREITCWYLKTTAMLETLQEIRELLKARKDADVNLVHSRPIS